MVESCVGTSKAGAGGWRRDIEHNGATNLPFPSREPRRPVMLRSPPVRRLPGLSAWGNPILPRLRGNTLALPPSQARSGELHDRSHRASRRQLRDRFVDSALGAASIPVLRVPRRNVPIRRRLLREQADAASFQTHSGGIECTTVNSALISLHSRLHCPVGRTLVAPTVRSITLPSPRKGCHSAH